MKKRTKTSNGLEILDHLAGNDPEMEELIAQERTNFQVAREIYRLRTAAGLSQGELAKRAVTNRSVISRLEDADCEHLSLEMLCRVAAALKCNVEVQFVSIRRPNHRKPYADQS